MRCDVTAYRTCRVCGSARECRGIGKEDREILGSKAGGRRRRDMISCRKGARSNVRDEIDMRSPCVCDRILFERRKGDGKEAISSSLLGKVTMKRYQGLQDRDFESINCEQRAQPSSFIVLYVDLVRVWRGASSSRRRRVVVASSSRRVRGAYPHMISPMERGRYPHKKSAFLHHLRG